MKRLPFRKRLTVWSTIVAAVALLVSGAITAFVVHRRELDRVDETLLSEGEHFFSELARHGGAKFDWKKIAREIREWMPLSRPAHHIEIRTGSTLRWRSTDFPPEGCAPLLPGLTSKVCGDRELRFLVQEHLGVSLTLGVDLSASRTLTSAVGWALLGALPVALAFAWLGARRLANAAVLPLEEMTRVAESITAEHIDKRLPVPAVADEVQRHAVVLNRTFDRLERSYQQAMRFSADASHELKSPLMVMRVGIESLLESQNLSDDEHQTVAALLEQTRRLSNIIGSLLLLARADAGRLELDLEEVELSPLIEGCVEDARIMAHEKNIRVTSALPELAKASIDSLRFSQIVSNLLDNAVKYNIEGGEIRVALSRRGDFWELDVSNTGPTIPPEMRHRLFERFFRAEHSGEGGQGLGLGLARELARAHGGDVHISKWDDGWVQFTVRFPRCRNLECNIKNNAQK